MAHAWCAAPDQPRNAEALLSCGAHLARADRSPPRLLTDDDAPLADGHISFVICSIDPARLTRLKIDLDRFFAGDAWELIHIDDARSLSEGYTRGMQAARGDLIVFCHDDIGIINADFAQKLRAQLQRFDLIGLAGTQQIVGPSWHWGGPLRTASRVATPRPAGDLIAALLGPYVESMPNAQAVDGVFMAGKRHVFERVPFDSETFDGFHFYDIDQSYRAHCAGFSCAVALDLLIWHQSGGNWGDAWRNYAQRFVEKFPQFEPAIPAAAYRPGACVISPALAPTMYAWVDHWLRAI